MRFMNRNMPQQVVFNIRCAKYPVWILRIIITKQQKTFETKETQPKSTMLKTSGHFSQPILQTCSTTLDVSRGCEKVEHVHVQIVEV